MLKKNWLHGLATTTALLTLLVATPLQAQLLPQPITPDSSVDALAAKKQYATVPNFRIGGSYNLDQKDSWQNGGEGGVTLESLGGGALKVGYITMGTPEKDKNGQIINAIVISSYYSGDAAATYNVWVEGQPGTALALGGVIGPGKLFDTDKYYIVMFDALGLWGASKPSQGLGMKFPVYNYYDMVQANYRVLRDTLKVGKVKLATGASMGASQTYYWGLMHPEMVEAIMPIGGSTATDTADPVVFWTFRLMTNAIKSDPVWQKVGGDYYKLPKDQHPNQGVAFGWSMLGLTGFDLNYRGVMPWEQVKGEIFAWNPQKGEGAGLVAKAKVFDAVDLIYRNLCGDQHNINKLLPRITVRTLIIHVENDQWLLVEKAREAATAITGAQILTFRNPLAHYAVFQAPNLYRKQITAFMNDDPVCATPGAGAASAGAAAQKPAGFSK